MVVRTTGDVYSSFYRSQHGNDGKRSEVHRYDTTIIKASPAGSHLFAFYPDIGDLSDGNNRAKLATNQAISRFYSNIESSQYLASLIEAKGTRDTLTTRAIKMLRLAKAIKRRDVKAIKRYFNPKSGERRSAVPAAWLEFNFVYKPLWSDVKQLSAILDQPLSGADILGSGRAEGVTYDSDWPRQPIYWKHRSYIGSHITVSNPNIGLVNRMGLTDVIGTAYELVPWSWAVDYFANVGDYLSNISPQFSDLDYSMAYTTNIVEKSGVMRRYIGDYLVPVSYGSMRMIRDPGIASYQFIFNFDLNLRRLSYLLSAVALTLKGKFK